MSKEKNRAAEAAIFAFAFLAPELAQAQSAPVPAVEAPPAAPAPAQTTLPPVTAHEVHQARPKPAVHAARKPVAVSHAASHPHPQVRAASRHPAVVRHPSAAPSTLNQSATRFTPDYGAPNVGQGPVAAPGMASQMTFTGEDLNARPVTRPGEMLEAAPGLIVTQHSGEGKANQYFLRGYNLDHGTDMAIWVDDMPINMRTHAHGQGYSDLNWLMPETVNSRRSPQGPIFRRRRRFRLGRQAAHRPDRHRRQGDCDDDDGQLRLSSGCSAWVRLNWARATCSMLAKLGAYNGPWTNPDDMRKINGLLRYTPGDSERRLYTHRHGLLQHWNSTDQVPNAGDHVGADRPIRRGRSDRRRQYKTLLAVGPDRRTPTTPDHGRPTPMPSKANSTCSTILHII